MAAPKPAGVAGIERLAWAAAVGAFSGGGLAAGGTAGDDAAGADALAGAALIVDFSPKNSASSDTVPAVRHSGQPVRQIRSSATRPPISARRFNSTSGHGPRRLPFT